MVFIGFVLLGVGLVIGVLLALSDPVLLSRINGEEAQGQSGRHIHVAPPPEREEERRAASVTVAV